MFLSGQTGVMPVRFVQVLKYANFGKDPRFVHVSSINYLRVRFHPFCRLSFDLADGIP